MRTIATAILVLGFAGTARAQSAVYPELRGAPVDLVAVAREQGWGIEAATACDNLPWEDGLTVLRHMQDRAARRFDKVYSEKVAGSWLAGDTQAKADIARDRAATCRTASGLRSKVDNWRKASIRWRDGD